MSERNVRALAPEDAEAYRRLRDEMLLDSPWAFGSAPGDDPNAEVEALRTGLADPENAILAIDDGGGAPVAVAGILRSSRKKMRHWAYIWGVYTTPSARGQGLSRRLMVAALDLARTWDGVEMIGIAASVNSPAALALYESLGFVAWGREPNVTRVGDETFDEIHMALRL